MGGTGEEVEGFDCDDVVVGLQNGNIADLGGGIAREVNNHRWYNFT